MTLVTKHRRCPKGCGWHDKSYGACPKCGDEPKFNKGLRTAALNSHLYRMAEGA